MADSAQDTVTETVTIASPQAHAASTIDQSATLLALRLVSTLGPRFNLRRDINDVMTLCARHLRWPQGVVTRLQRFLSQRCADLPAWRDVLSLSPEAFVGRHGIWNGTYDDTTIFYFLDEYAKQNGKEILVLLQSTADAIERELRARPCRLQLNIALLGRVLGLTAAEQALLHAAALAKCSRDLRPVLVDCKVTSATEGYGLLAQVSGVEAADIAAALKTGSRLEMLALIDTPIAAHNVTDLGDLMRLSDRLLPLLQEEYHDEAALMAAFTKPARSSTLTLADFPHVEDDARYLAALLASAAERGEAGVNVLIYGSPGTGKTEFAKVVAAMAGAELYEVECFDREGASLTGKERYRSLQVSQTFLKGRCNTLLLFDEVEDVFPSNPSDMLNMYLGDEHHRGSVNGKAWVNQTLETNPVPTIWISNAINQIDPAYRRRFQFHLELKNPPQSVRSSITRKHLAGLPVSEGFIEKLAARRNLTPAQIHAAARFAELTRERIGDDVETLIERQLDRAEAALGQKSEPGADVFRPSVTRYDLTLLNVETRHPIERIVASLAIRGSGSLLFHGLPGTGKTALAEHIARTIERPLMIRKASDLISKWVGETEQNMASMFKDAAAEKAVLLLDEADSFFQPRGLAQRSYEVTEVNEMLQQMERFGGVFVCTTNLLDRIDEAALRRFTFKIRFNPLRPEQRLRMFVAEALEGDETRLTEHHRQMLGKLDLLTPGDFAAVKRQIALFDEPLVADDFLAQLVEEHAVKPDVKWARRIGF